MGRDKLSFKATIASPCEESWTAMQGGSRERHCQLCDKQVHNFAAMTSREIERVVREADGKLCARITRRGDGSLVTLDARPRASMAAQVVASASLAMSAASVAAQSSSEPPKPNVTESAKGEKDKKLSDSTGHAGSAPGTNSTFIGVVTVTANSEIEPTPDRIDAQIEDDSPSSNGNAILTGTVLKQDGSGPMKGATISICSATGEAAQVRSDAQGRFRTTVPVGIYDIHLTEAKNTTTFRAFTLNEGEQELPPLTLSTTVTVTAQGFDSSMMGTMQAVIAPRPWWYPFRHPVAYMKQAIHRA